MSEPQAEAAEPEAELPAPGRKRRWLLVLAGLLVLALGSAWFARERIANRIIAGQLEDLGLPGRYEIESIGTQRQVLKNIVIGNPARPDLVVPRAVVEFEPRLGVPTLNKVTLEGARLFGSYREGKLSFGALDTMIFAKRTGPGGLPDLNLVLIDGRARIDSDFGPIGAKAQGQGNLRSGFAGVMAVAGPKLDISGCAARNALAFGKVTTASARARFAGPLRISGLSCPDRQIVLGQTTVQLDALLGEAFESIDGRYELAAARPVLPGLRAAGLNGDGDFTFKAGDLIASHDLTASGLDLGAASLASLRIDGAVRSRDRLTRFEGEGAISGRELRTGKGLGAALADLEQTGEGTLLAPLAQQLRRALAREERGSELGGRYSLRQTGGITQIVVPVAELTGGSGTRLVGLSRFGLSLGLKGGPRFSGNFVTGGAGLPRLTGTAQRKASGGVEARFSLAEYRAGNASVALPELRLVQLPSGQIGFGGRALVSGPLPGGEVRGLALPIDGTWTARQGLAAWRRCTPIGFERFKVGNLSLEQRGLTLCPGPGGAILRSDGRGTRLAAGTAGLNLAGTLGTTPIRLRSGAVGFAWPGRIAARAIDVSMGPLAESSTLKVASFDGSLGKVVTGRFAGTELKLFQVPLDVYDGSGELRFADQKLTISNAALMVKDREKDARFYPLLAREATVDLVSTTFTARATLRHPKSDREVVRTVIVHDLDTGVGHADLDVPGILFDAQLQPDMLTFFAQGIIALADGVVTGDGRIDWNGDGVTSTGDFTTAGLNFDAAFGAVDGLAGTVEFSDLLGLVTKPDQKLKIGMINPGIEVYDGEVSFQLEADRWLRVNGAKWPFIDGTLEMLPTTMQLGEGAVRRFTMKVEGANAAKFVQQLDLGNIAANGIFDGTIPLVFDQEGGRIEGGLLISRPPGGNLSYVGELTYKDLSAMGNFAFQTLRSLDFTRMEIGLSGNIDGDILTTLRIEGVRQGKGAKRNFITRQLGKMPVQFNINIRAPFYQLVTSFKSFYDPAYIRSPRAVGLVDESGKPIEKPKLPDGLPGQGNLPAVPPASPKSDDIQDSDSRTSP